MNGITIKIGQQYKSRESGKIATVTEIVAGVDEAGNADAVVVFQKPDGFIDGLNHTYELFMRDFSERYEAV